MPTVISGTSEITQIWTVEQQGTFNPGTSFGDMTDMDVTITVNAGETVYVMFNAWIKNTISTYLIGGVRIMRDTVLVSGSQREFNIESSNGATQNSITTQFIIKGLAAGTYELKVQAHANPGAGSGTVEDGLLIVYTFR